MGWLVRMAAHVLHTATITGGAGRISILINDIKTDNSKNRRIIDII